MATRIKGKNITLRAEELVGSITEPTDPDFARLHMPVVDFTTATLLSESPYAPYSDMAVYFYLDNGQRITRQTSDSFTYPAGTMAEPYPAIPLIRGTGTGSAVTFGESVACCGATLSGFIVTGGSAENGGGVNGDGMAHGIVERCVIVSNQAATMGGGVYNCAHVYRNLIWKNVALLNGGGIGVDDGASNIINNILLANLGAGSGAAGIQVATGASAYVLFNDLLYNFGFNNQLSIQNSSVPYAYHCIVWGNERYDKDHSEPPYYNFENYSYCLLRNGPGIQTLEWYHLATFHLPCPYIDGQQSLSCVVCTNNEPNDQHSHMDFHIGCPTGYPTQCAWPCGDEFGGYCGTMYGAESTSYGTAELGCPLSIHDLLSASLSLSPAFRVCFLSKAGLPHEYDCDGTYCGTTLGCYSADWPGHFKPMAPLHQNFTFDHLDMDGFTYSPHNNRGAYEQYTGVSRGSIGRDTDCCLLPPDGKCCSAIASVAILNFPLAYQRFWAKDARSIHNIDDMINYPDYTNHKNILNISEDYLGNKRILDKDHIANATIDIGSHDL